MRYYRLYFLDAAGRIHQAADMQHPDDAAAIEAADLKSDGRAMELWSRDRLVQRFERPEGSSVGGTV